MNDIKHIKNDIYKVLEKGIKNKVFAGAVAAVGIGNGEKSIKIESMCGNSSIYPQQEEIGKDYYFDLASLTKPLATTLAVLCLIKIKKLDLDEKLPDLLERKIEGKKKEIKLRNLLSHSSGLPAYREYFNYIAHENYDDFNIKLLNKIIDEPLNNVTGKKAEYSDLGFMLLGMIIEKKSGVKFDEFVKNNIFMPLKLEDKLFFNRLPFVIKGDKKFVATEKCMWRKKVLVGEVSDENAYAMGGVSGHAGLFGNIEGVLSLTLNILDQWKGRKKHSNYKSSDLKKFLNRQKEIEENTWALGFDTPSLKKSSGGDYLSPLSVGHLGFTGTSFWIDPTRDLVMILLTNRIHPNRNNEKIKEFRPYFHNTIMESLGFV
ncbi:MAG: serine hydrolase [Proteobacteria bacterium]|nr:serine hydrolase [Pseudomonadota bacterium]MBU1715532.1 serine hydrolase [Pseudomonadota bacterium]